MVLSAIAGYLFFMSDPRVTYGIPAPLLASLSFAVGLGLVALSVSILLPDYRFAFEIIGIVLLIYALISVKFPILTSAQSGFPLLNIFIFLIVLKVSFHLIYGNWSDNLLVLDTQVDRSVTVTDVDQLDLWETFFPDPNNVGYYHDETTEKISLVSGQANTFHVLNRFKNGHFQEMMMQFDHVKPTWSYRYRYEVIGAPELKRDRLRSCTVSLEPRDNRTAVHIRWERPNYAVRKAFMHWVDDWAGRRLDKMVHRADVLHRPNTNIQV
ncbi:hypothetical protein COL8621_02088 [Actibacterium lipolyticum]|uniref:Uncharacterized protein n=2 Tax=Actibacterium lipolyticum TaxID=1524263 RepID=A0A238KJC5_9RHOB|nr:hypothetical protein COL8621_02088 [Actibacterium lipolyticum]